MQQKTLPELKAELLTVQNRIKKATPKDDSTLLSWSITGRSGRNAHQLNKRMERHIDRSIQAARVLTPLYEREGQLLRLINEIESGAKERKEQAANNRAVKLAAYWNGIKPGDEVVLPLGNTVTVAKKNKKSIETTSGTKWAVAEIIGKQAAQLI